MIMLISTHNKIYNDLCDKIVRLKTQIQNNQEINEYILNGFTIVIRQDKSSGNNVIELSKGGITGKCFFGKHNGELSLNAGLAHKNWNHKYNNALSKIVKKHIKSKESNHD